MQNHRISINSFVVSLALLTTTIVAYWPILSADFIGLDDPTYAIENTVVRQGLTMAGVRWAFTSFEAANWHPLTWISLMLDVTLYGINPPAFHMTNLLYHLANVLLLLFIFYQMTNNLWAATMVASFFALHPLHVESVAWISERKDVLSTFWGLLAILAYYRYTLLSSFGRYLLVFLFFLMSLLSKPMLIALPMVFLLLDYWPLSRFHAGNRLKQMWKLAVEKVPFLSLTIVSCIITLMAQNHGKAVAALDLLPMDQRIANALLSYSVYLCKMVWPVDLAPFYPHPGMPALWQVVLSTLFLILITVFSLMMVKSRPWLAVGWLWYLGTLVPVIGVVQVGRQAMADRYTYYPLIGIFIMIAYSINFRSTQSMSVKAIRLTALPTIPLLIGLTFMQAAYWQNTVSLFRHTLAVGGESVLAHRVLAQALSDRGDIHESIFHFRQALRMDPQDAEARVNFGALLAETGRWEEAVAMQQEALRLNPNLKKAHNNLGNIHARFGRLDEAVSFYRNALKIDPQMETTHNNLGVAYLRQGKREEAIDEFTKALAINPHYSSALKNLEKVESQLLLLKADPEKK